MLSALIAEVEQKRAELVRLRPLKPHALNNLVRAFDLELTYTSNAIEGNTLTQVETNLVIEHGVTVGGKSLKDHLEAIDHHEALGFMRQLAARDAAVTEHDVRNLHALVMRRSAPDLAGRYATAGRYMNTDAGRISFPPPAELPALMGDFGLWLRGAPPSAESAFAAHRKLVEIHPFGAGNGRTARLLMNLILIRGGYPPVAFRPEDRLEYLRALQRQDESFRQLLYSRLAVSLRDYLQALAEAKAPGSDGGY